MSFDPYYEWLGIPPEEQPADHYRLLAIRRFEPNPIVIENAAERQLLLLKTLQNGPRGEVTQRLMNEVTAARICLLDPHRRAEYDAKLRRPRAERDTQPFPMEPFQPDGSAREFDLTPPKAEGGGQEMRLAPSDSDHLWRDLKLAPSEVGDAAPEERLPLRGTRKAPESRPVADVPATPVELPPLEPLAGGGSLPLGGVSRRRLPRLSKTPRKLRPGTSRRVVQRETPRSSALVIFGGLAVGVYIGVTLILIWIYGSGGGSRGGGKGSRPAEVDAVDSESELEREPQDASPRATRKTPVLKRPEHRAP